MHAAVCIGQLLYYLDFCVVACVITVTESN